MRRLKYWLPVFLWMAFIFGMSTGTFSSDTTASILESVVRVILPSISEPELQMMHHAVRKSAHLLEYFVLGLLLFNAFRGGSEEQRVRQWALYSLTFSALYAASDEFHQAFVATRTASLIDVCIDITGSALALCAAVLWSRRRGRQ